MKPKAEVHLHELALTISDVLELPRDTRKGKSYAIVKAIFKTMSDALQSGQDVFINGIGTFRVRRVNPRKVGATYFSKIHPKFTFTEVHTLPSKKYVAFIPNRALIRSLNDVAQS